MQKDTEVVVPIAENEWETPPPNYTRIVINTVRPFIEKIPLNATAVLLRGPIVFVMNTYLKRLGYKPIFMFVADRPWGSRLDNGSYTANLGDIWNGKIDISVGPNTVTPERHDDFFVSHRFVYPINGILSWKPRKIVEPFGFVNTLQPEVWALTFFAMLSLSFTPAILQQINSGIQSKYKIFSFFSQQFFVLFTSLMGQSFQQRMRLTTWWYYTLFVTWFIARLFLVTMFSSEMMNMMLLRKSEFSVNTLDDVLKKPDIQVMVPNGTTYEYEFRKPRTPLFQALQRRMGLSYGMLLGGGPHVVEAMTKLENRKAVLFCPIAMLQTIAGKWLKDYPEYGCSTKIVEENSVPTAFATLTNKTFSNKHIIEDTIIRIEEAHIFKKHEELFVRGYQDCTARSKLAFTLTSLGFKELAGVFFLWFFCICCAIVGLIAERFVSKSAKKRLILTSDRK